MKSANKTDREPLDRYDSPLWMPACLLHTLPPFPKDTIFLEPCKGGGAISGFLQHQGFKVITADIDPSTNPDFVLDMTKPDSWRRLPRFDYTVSNLPFNVAASILEQALQYSRGVMVVLRKTWDEPTRDRYPLLLAHPWSHKINLPRYKFRRTKDPTTGLRTGHWQTDSTPVDWFLWMPGLAIPSVSFYSKDRINTFAQYTENPEEEAIYAGRYFADHPPL